ncbi:hypothetical protein SD70_31240 [Gordoniibacillus kamchatkensis]|uniref:DUF948 domain-containing protein n=1 Tax=Gordoniibacillus kamchatkensis TaxID=1590651 RepID=A0ABR5A7B7_9BACL|nr:DUF948 domain-containing protein [Paenibacillus sp. VKM B-2647]KIL36802.1 hypothetical protein SD70_31240 [Paenibacillus sp. VKM B-2647]
MQVAQWCAVVAAAAFVVLTAVAVRTMLAVSRTMGQVSHALARFELQLEETGGQTTRLLQQTEAIAAEVQSKLQELSSFTASVRNVGDSLNEVGGTVRQASRQLARSVLEVEQAVHTHRARVQEALEWAATGVQLWRQWQSGRKMRAEAKQRENE